jgi:hypothetical protein
MNRARLLRFAVLASLVSSLGAAADGWSQLKAGMSRSETIAVLGTELVASSGRGFQIAIYDNRAETVFLNGQLVAWTAPVTSHAPTASVDAWQFDQVSRARAGAQAAARAAQAPTGAVRQKAILPAYRW